MFENAATATRVDAFKGEEFGSGIRCVSSLPPRREAADQPQELPVSMANVIGQSESLVEVYRVVDRIAATDCTVLVTGESGTGKELVAKALHDASPRAQKAFVAVNCGAIPEALLESELFGHARGAFTGAHAAKQGRIALAQGGTLFLDEIGEMPMSLQVKLLRVLQAREYSPVGDTRTLTADVRIVAATNVQLEEAVRDGRFREDLYYRLNVIHLQVPPLRERADDIPLLVDHFLARVGGSYAVPQEVMAELCAYRWPGNVRELENAVERAVALAASDGVLTRDLLLEGALRRRAKGAPTDADAPLVTLREVVREAEARHIRRVLAGTHGHRAQAAKILGISRKNLWEKMKDLEIE